MTNSGDMMVSHTLSLSLEHISRLVNLAHKLKRSKSELAREALDDLFAKYDAPKEVSDVENVVMPALPLVYGEPETTA